MQDTTTAGEDPLLGELLTPEDLARIFRVSVRTVYSWRSRDVGPPGFRVGGAVRYRREDVAAWVRNGGTLDRSAS